MTNKLTKIELATQWILQQISDGRLEEEFSILFGDDKPVSIIGFKRQGSEIPEFLTRGVLEALHRNEVLNCKTLYDPRNRQSMGSVIRCILIDHPNYKFWGGLTKIEQATQWILQQIDDGRLEEEFSVSFGDDKPASIVGFKRQGSEIPEFLTRGVLEALDRKGILNCKTTSITLWNGQSIDSGIRCILIHRPDHKFSDSQMDETQLTARWFNQEYKNESFRAGFSKIRVSTGVIVTSIRGRLSGGTPDFVTEEAFNNLIRADCFSRDGDVYFVNPKELEAFLSSDTLDSTLEDLNLIKLIKNHFTLDEIKTLILHVGGKFEELPGDETLGGKSRELVLWAKRRKKMEALIKAIKEERPNIDV